MKTVSPSRLLVLLCVLASSLVPGIASAQSAAGAENRVWAFDPVEQVHVGDPATRNSEQHQGYDPRDYDSASDSLLAARGERWSEASWTTSSGGLLEAPITFGDPARCSVGSRASVLMTALRRASTSLTT